MNRRAFLETACKGVAAIAIGGAVLDLAGIKTIRAKSRLGANELREIPLNLLDTPELKPIGGSYHLEVEDLNRDILVAHVSENQFVAVDIKCTHKGCDITYQSDRKTFQCPCHNSEFALTGFVLQGPAKKNLNYYHAELKGDEVLVTVYGPDDPVPANCVPVVTKIETFPDSTHTSTDSTIHRADSTFK